MTIPILCSLSLSILLLKVYREKFLGSRNFYFEMLHRSRPRHTHTANWKDFVEVLTVKMTHSLGI